ncbi:hypothetical protein OG884_22705 [Streptosporangium sp. NBC_01755]|uniref:hypothetical protein n=1 Tax=Streptosporangium sp. NBC_01755 TaxID=2975949 RepID=UPI002DDAE11D|nr:hypothetical protein [Streptosporangium sp. NBC_01755]WSC97700.1 hypothetical protein OG884_22705 [Streptosporangium sp. NBC_01755]
MPAGEVRSPAGPVFAWSLSTAVVPQDLQVGVAGLVPARRSFPGAAGTANLVYLIGEIGVGAGITLDGRLRRGGRGYGGGLR